MEQAAQLIVIKFKAKARKRLLLAFRDIVGPVALTELLIEH